MSEPFWDLSGLIMDEDVDGKGSGGVGWVSSLGAGLTCNAGCRFGAALWGDYEGSEPGGAQES